MPDLTVHLLATYLVNKKLRLNLYFVLLGAMFPDLLGRILVVLVPQNYLATWVSTILHTPLIVFGAVYLVCLLFKEEKRKEYFVALIFGSLGHLTLDALQKHYRVSYYWLFPFSFKSFAVSALWSDEFVLIIPFLLILTAVVVWREKKEKGKIE